MDEEELVVVRAVGGAKLGAVCSQMLKPTEGSQGGSCGTQVERNSKKQQSGHKREGELWL